MLYVYTSRRRRRRNTQRARGEAIAQFTRALQMRSIWCVVFWGFIWSQLNTPWLTNLRRLNTSPALFPPRLRETYYIARCCCSWPLLLLPLVQGASRTATTTAWGAMAEVFSDDFNFKIGDVLSCPLSLATCQQCARPFTPARPLHAHTSCC
jgi:hypothetical protein